MKRLAYCKHHQLPETVCYKLIHLRHTVDMIVGPRVDERALCNSSLVADDVFLWCSECRVYYWIVHSKYSFAQQGVYLLYEACVSTPPLEFFCSQDGGITLIGGKAGAAEYVVRPRFFRSY